MSSEDAAVLEGGGSQSGQWPATSPQAEVCGREFWILESQTHGWPARDQDMADTGFARNACYCYRQIQTPPKPSKP